ncbi:inositol monophosphatase family protein [Microbacterium sp. C7(2022)]|uniref:inositol monophosphatase family protein n=1 Tax=Microbacterium sp. C7(2022) TaxID=2992759 RepID=UPI00237B1A76|nr:inositol monophosphatase family protein [Microbacterium sp. C7(2022)]MDE0546122.1 inositol monophosphatase [Microbacterium sp. C7(2022)]
MTSAAQLAELATDIAREAGVLARQRREEGVRVADTKSSIADIVTEADREVEALIRRRLREARPEDGFVGEESEPEHGASGITWVVDPIDGTVNYAYGIPHYAVSIAAVQGVPEPAEWTALAGVVYGAVSGELFHAVAGEGAFLDGRPIAVNPEPSAAGALLATGFGYDPRSHAGDLAQVERVMPYARDLRRFGSAALDLCAVACGRLDGYFERGLKPWDHAAGGLIITEAGGRIDVGSEPDDFGRVLVVASGPALFDRLLTAARGA